MHVAGDPEGAGGRRSRHGGPQRGHLSGHGLAGRPPSTAPERSVEVLAVVIGGGAMAATDASLARLGVSDPRQWSVGDWLSDAVPHAANRLVTATVLEALS